MPLKETDAENEAFAFEGLSIIDKSSTFIDHKNKTHKETENLTLTQKLQSFVVVIRRAKKYSLYSSTL